MAPDIANENENPYAAPKALPGMEGCKTGPSDGELDSGRWALVGALLGIFSGVFITKFFAPASDVGTEGLLWLYFAVPSLFGGLIMGLLCLLVRRMLLDRPWEF